MKQLFFITGTDTGVGKTVLAALLARFLRGRGVNAGALKPVCAGGRADALALHAAMNGALTLEEINPWHFRAPIAPLLAARNQHQRVRLSAVLAHIRAVQKRFEAVLVEGAGGLLSPLGVSFNSRDLIVALRATPLLVAQNRLGVVNHILLTLEGLPKHARQKAKVVLMSPHRPDSASKTNINLLEEFIDAKRIFPLPWLGKSIDVTEVLKDPGIKRSLQSLSA